MSTKETMDLESRRKFLRSAGIATGMAALAPALIPLARAAGTTTGAGAAASSAIAATLRLAAPGNNGPLISRRLVGLSYEVLQMRNPAFFSADSKKLITFFRTLNPHGVLRIGGNSSDLAVWSEYRGSLPTFQQPPGVAFPLPYLITPEQLRNLGEFLRATGWQLVFGLNVQTGTPEMAAELAEAVQRSVGDNLLAVQIGNEPNDFTRLKYNPIKGFDINDYMVRWITYAKAIRKRVSIPITGPDTGVKNGLDWITGFGKTAPDISMLTGHFYRSGAPLPDATIPVLLSGNPKLVKGLGVIHEEAARLNMPVAITEINSFWGGGKLGVSNTFASALWGGDVILVCARAGVEFLDFHGGTLDVVEDSVSKSAPSEAGPGHDVFDRLDQVSSRYGPIAGNVKEGFYARPLYYGILMARQFAGSQFVDCELDAPGVNATAYAALSSNGGGVLAVFNKDLHQDIRLQVNLGRPANNIRIWRLEAPSVEDVHHVRFAGSQVSLDGTWSPRGSGATPAQGSQCSVDIPRTSAVLIAYDS